MPLCLVGVIIGEFIGARKGLGYLIIYSSQTFKLTWVLMSIIILCIIAIILYGLLGLCLLYTSIAACVSLSNCLILQKLSCCIFCIFDAET